MRQFLQDLGFSIRLLRKAPTFTAVALVMLALGIGANTAIFTLLDQAVLRRLPVKEPSRLVLLRYAGINNGYSYNRIDAALTFSYPMYRDLRDHKSVFNGLIASAWAHVGVQWHNESQLEDAEMVSGNYFDVLGVQPAIGHLFVPSEDVAQEASPVVVLSFAYWQRRFGSDPHIVGQIISINGHPFTVVGVAAPGFHSVVSGDNPAVFVPITMKPEITPGWNDLDARRSVWLNIVGRLKPGFTREQAQAGIDPLWHAIRAQELSEMGHSSQRLKDEFLTYSHLFLEDGSKGVRAADDSHTSLLVVMGMAALMVLIACANVACLLLVRVASRAREISVRYALGAKRSRVIQQLLAEGLLLGMVGGMAGIVLSPQISRLLTRILWSQPEELGFSTFPDLRILAFSAFLTLSITILFSLAPALQFWRPDVSAALKQQAATVAQAPLHLRRSLVVAQIGLSLLLLVGAGLFVRTLHNLKKLDVGFTTTHLVTFSIDPRLAGYERSETAALYQRILDQLAGLPEVRSVAATSDPELDNNNSSSNITVAGYRPTENEDMNVETAGVSAGYFSTLQTPLLAGRELSDQDRAGTQKVAVVNESFARKYFRQPQNAIGHYFCWGAGDVTPDIEIVGVVKDALHTNLRDRIRRTVFTPFLQAKQAGTNSGGMTFYVRTWQGPESAESAIRQSMHTFDSNIVLNHLLTMQEVVDENVTSERAVALLASSFGMLAALMAAIGIYGVLAYSTAQRIREFGIRIAVGATRATVMRMVLAEIAWMAGLAVAVSLPLSIALARSVRSQLFGVSSGDPLTLIVVCGLIAVVALVSAALPARRAAKVDPMVALRYE